MSAFGFLLYFVSVCCMPSLHEIVWPHSHRGRKISADNLQSCEPNFSNEIGTTAATGFLSRDTSRLNHVKPLHRWSEKLTPCHRVSSRLSCLATDTATFRVSATEDLYFYVSYHLVRSQVLGNAWNGQQFEQCNFKGDHNAERSPSEKNGQWVTWFCSGHWFPWKGQSKRIDTNLAWTSCTSEDTPGSWGFWT